MLALPTRRKNKLSPNQRNNRPRKIKTLPSNVLWQGRPSLVLALDKLGLTFLATAIALAVWWQGIAIQGWMVVIYGVVAGFGGLRWLAKVISILCVQYTVTTERLLYKHGVFNRITDEIELFRVRDFQIREPLALRPWGLGNVILVTSDRTHPEMLIEAVPETARLHELIRNQVRVCWMNRGVYEVDAG